MEEKCKYTPTERTGLYIMVMILFFFGPCTKIFEHQEVMNKLDKIEQTLQTNKIIE